MTLSRRLSYRVAALAAAFTCLGSVSAAAAGLGIGFVNADALRLRSEPSTDAGILATLPADNRVVVLEEAGEDWYKVDYKSVEGYMSKEYLDLETCVDCFIGYGMVCAEGSVLNVRSGPGTDYDRVDMFADGRVVKIVGMDNGWYKVLLNENTDETGYVSGDYIVICKDDTGYKGSETAEDSSLGQQVADYAAGFLGTPYVWGGNGPRGFDCSGFTKYVYAHFGVTLNRTASAQLSNGTSVSKEELRAGDLIFFHNGKVSTPASHVAIYVGGGRFIHASTNTYAVQYDSIYSGTYSRMFIGARRIF